MSTTEKLQRIINAANHFITNTRKFDLGLTYMRRHVLHWLDMSDRIQFRQSVSVSLATSVYTEWHLVTCQTCADQWLHFKDDVTCVLLVAAIMTYLVSDVPLWKLVVFYAGPSAWNALPGGLGDTSLSLLLSRFKFVSPVF